VPRIVTDPEELSRLLAEYGPDVPENAAFLSRLVGDGAKEVVAADAFWNTGAVPGFESLPAVTTVYVNERDEARGAVVAEDIPRGRWSSGRRHLTIRCEEPDAMAWILSLVPEGESCTLDIEQEQLLSELESLAAVSEAYDRLYYTVDSESFKPFRHDDVIWLGEDDRQEIERFSDREAGDGGLARFYHALQLAGLPMITAAVRDGDEIASFCCMGKKTEQVWSAKWVCTAEDRRKCGNGKRVLSAATDRILQMGKSPLYSLRESNAASRHLCESVGYRLASVMSVLTVSV